jgi:hypothetical protein
MALSSSEMEDLATARNLLENPGLAARISDAIGSPIEKGFALLPAAWERTVNDAARKSVEAALKIALLTLDHRRQEPPANRWHKLAAGASGAVGGAFGLPALAVELPVSTAIMLRSIADIARSQGENLENPEAGLACLQVLALGGRSKEDDGAETAYFAVRAAMARAVSDAAEHLARKGLSDGGAPVIVRLISRIASRFSIVVSEKAAAQAIPVVGAVGGAVINTLFMDHFQNMGRGHFIIRRLERLHGSEEIRRLYEGRR